VADSLYVHPDGHFSCAVPGARQGFGGLVVRLRLSGVVLGVKGHFVAYMRESNGRTLIRGLLY